MDHIWIIYGLYMDYLQHHEDIMTTSFVCFTELALTGNASQNMWGFFMELFNHEH
ncbi:MAG: hypothetical protein PHT07_14490 [Paludibacter sp.]|nr:hypothetical protein [Paludibacter sp.]